MPYIRKTSVLVEYRLRCPTCMREQKLTHGASWNIGDTIMPAKGHGDLGRCVFCRHDGLFVLERLEAPVESKYPRPLWA